MTPNQERFRRMMAIYLAAFANKPEYLATEKEMKELGK